MQFLQDSEDRFKSNLSNAEEIDKFLIDGLERSYTIDSANKVKRTNTIPEDYREKNIPMPPLEFSYKINEETIKQNNLISPAAIFDHIEDLTKAKMMRKSMQDIPSTLNKTTLSAQAKQISAAKKQEKDAQPKKELKRKPMLNLPVKKRLPTDHPNPHHQEILETAERLSSRKTDRILINHPPFNNAGDNAFFITEPKSIDFTTWQVGKVYEQSLEIKNVSDHSRYFRLLPPSGKHFALGLGQYIGKDTTENSCDASSAHVAPGMSAKFSIRFIPDSLKNIEDSLTLQCESGRNLNIKIKAKRQAPVLTIPKELDLGGCLIGQVKTEIFRICNVAGDGRFMITSAAHWKAHVQSGKVPKFTTEVVSADGVFRIRPGFLALKKDEMANLIIQIAPQEVKAYRFELAIICDNCNVQYVTCHVRGQNAFIENISIIETAENSLTWNFVESDHDHGAKNKIRLDMLPIRPNNPRRAILRLDNPGEVDLSFVWTKLKLFIQNSLESSPMEVDDESPIVVIPNSGTLPAKSTCEFDIIFNPEEICQFQTLLSLNLIDSKDQTAFEMEVYTEATGIQVSLNTCIISPPKNIVEIGETFMDKVVMTNHDQTVPVDFDWSSYASKNGVVKIYPEKGRINPGCDLEFDVEITANNPGVFEAINFCSVAHILEPIRLLTKLDVEEPKVICQQPSIEFNLLRVEGVNEVTLELWNPSEQHTIDYKILPNVGADLEIFSKEMFGILLPEEKKSIILYLTGCHENLDFKGYIEILSARTKSSDVAQQNTLKLATVLPIRGKICLPKLTPSQSIITIDQSFAPNIISKTPVTLTNTGLIPVAFEFNSFAIDKLEGQEEIVLKELSDDGNDFKLTVLQPGQNHVINLNLAWEKPVDLHQINLLFNVFAVDGYIRGNTRSESRKRENTFSKLESLTVTVNESPAKKAAKPVGIPEPQLSILPLLVAIRAAPENVKVHIQESELIFDNLPINSMMTKNLTLVNNTTVDTQFSAEFLNFKNSAEISCVISNLSEDADSNKISAGSQAMLNISVLPKMFGEYQQVILVKIGLQEMRIPITIKATGCPLTLPMFASEVANPILRFSKMNTQSTSKARTIKVNNPTNIPMTITWRLYWQKDPNEEEIPMVELYPSSAFLPQTDEDCDEVNLRALS